MNIINDNFAVCSYFDNVSEGFVSRKYLSKEIADEILKTKKNTFLYTHRVVEHVSIIGIVPFNSTKAYVFNYLPTTKVNTNDRIEITAKTFEELMNCYVFQHNEISKKELEILEDDYYKRGGKIYDDYRAFENEILKKERKKRKKQFRNELVENIIKHGFRETGRNKWSNGQGVIVREKYIKRISHKYKPNKNHADLDIDFYWKLYIGALFSKYLTDVHQLSENVFCIPCNKNNTQRYHFTYFEIEFTTQN